MHYKSSKNQRLHVELCLMKMAHLNAAFSFAQEGAAPKKAKVADQAPASTSPISGANAVPSATMQLQGGAGVPSETLQKPTQGSVPSADMQQPHKQNTVPSEGLQQPPKPQQVTQDAHLAPPVEKPRPSIPVPPQKKLSKLPSLKDLQQQAQNPAPASTKVAEDADEVAYGAIVPVDEAKLRSVWHEILRRKKSENMLEFTLLNRPYQISDKNEILLQVDNPVQVDQFNHIRPALLTELKDRLQNRSIRISVEVVEQKDENRLYTSQDKFNYLADKYPLLVDMKQRFGLDTDF